MIKKVIVFTLMFMLIFSSISLAKVGDAQLESADKLVALGLLTGYEDGSLKLENNISRAEFTTIAVRLIAKDHLVDKYKKDTAFSDVSKSNWSAPYINIAVNEGLIKGYTDGTFKPNRKVSYGEVLTILVRLLGYEDSLNKNDTWPVNYAKVAVDLNLNGNLKLPLKSFAPRGDVAHFVDNSLSVKLNKSY
ncbi:MAG: S-layer homology domain-containing protein [Firmicutes bacterium]|nr:S-layer homology domain-containing protein [Bacillota bacterium]